MKDLRLSADQLSFFRDQGYLLVEGVFDASAVSAMAEEADAVLDRAARADRDLDATWQGGHLKTRSRRLSVLSVHDLQFHSALFTRMLVDDALTSVLAQLIGPNIQLHHNKLHVKPPEKGSPFPLHQDYPYFPHRGLSMTAAVVHLDDATEENGCVWVVPESHRLGPLVHRNEGSHYLDPDEWPFDRSVPCPAKAGDVLFFPYLTVHGSGINGSERPRRVWIIQARSPDDLPTADVHRSPGQGMMLRGIDQSKFTA